MNEEHDPWKKKRETLVSLLNKDDKAFLAVRGYGKTYTDDPEMVAEIDNSSLAQLLFPDPWDLALMFYEFIEESGDGDTLWWNLVEQLENRKEDDND